MFPLYRHECESCFDDCDCAKCRRCEAYYCRNCIIEFNEHHNSTGICPTCKKNNGILLNQYIYCTSIVPLLSAKMDKYRNRIRSKPMHRIIPIIKQGSSGFGLYDLLQLYLNRLYLDRNPETKDMITWSKKPLEVSEVKYYFGIFPVIIKRINDHYNRQTKKISPEADAMIVDILNAVKDINVEFNHLNYNTVHKERTDPPVTKNVLYLCVTDDEPILHTITFCDPKRNEEIVIKEMLKPLKPRKDSHIIECAKLAIRSNTDYETNDIIYRPILDPNKIQEIYIEPSFIMIPDIKPKPRKLGNKFFTINGDDHKYMAIEVRMTKTPIEINPKVAPIEPELSTDDVINDITYYHKLASRFIEIINRVPRKYWDRRGDPFSRKFNDLLNASTYIINYSNRLLNSTPKRAQSLAISVKALCDFVKSPEFDINGFMDQFVVYTHNATAERFISDFQPVFDEIVKRLFEDSAMAEIFEKTIADQLILSNNHASLPAKLLSGRELLSKEKTGYKPSILRCVCGGAIVDNVEDGLTVYRCTRCSNRLDRPPEQEVDEKTSALLESLEFKQCPNCGLYIDRYDGCPDMFCTECKIGFDWDTLQIKNNDNSNEDLRKFKDDNPLNSLLNDYIMEADRNQNPVHWFFNVLYKDNKRIREDLERHNESITDIIIPFLNDDTIALKYLNRKNIMRMCIKGIQSIFARASADAQEALRYTNTKGTAWLNNKHKAIVDRSYDDYVKGMDILTLMEKTQEIIIECTIEKARRSPDTVDMVTEEMEAEEDAMKEDFLNQLSARLEKLPPLDNEEINIGSNVITIKRC